MGFRSYLRPCENVPVYNDRVHLGAKLHCVAAGIRKRREKVFHLFGELSPARVLKVQT